MSIFKQVDRVRVAQARVASHRAEMATPAAALLARGHRHPLTTLGAAAGAGFVLGNLNVHPLRIPGLGGLLRGGLAEAVAQGARLIAELGVGVGDAGDSDAS
ncbi:MAG: hypothetical protein WA777_20620 [Rhodanobacter sp.]